MTPKRSNNKAGKALLLSFIGLGLLIVPEVSFAAGKTAATTRTKVDFCSAVDAFAEKLNKDMTESTARFGAKETDRQVQLDLKIAQQEAERQNSRFTWDNSRDKVYTDLSARASTDAQKAAIKKFRAAVDLAVEARRKSVDKATTDFKSGVDKGISARKTSVEKATLLFKDSADKALSDAKADCTKGVASADARTRYITALEAAQQQLKQSLAQIKTSDNLRALVSARQAAIEQAAKDFKTAVTKAENTLKLAFPDA